MFCLQIREISQTNIGDAIMSWLYTIIFAGLSISSQNASAPVQQPAASEPTIAIVQSADETENFEQTYPLNASGRVNLSNVNGSIVVEAWDRNEVKLQYTKVADSKDRLADVEVKIESRSDYFSAEVDYGNWRKGTDGWKSGKLNVEFRLMVPRGAMLNEVETVNGSVTVSNFTNFTKISAVNGSVKATNIRGTARLSTVNGEVDADFDRLESGTKINAETVNGRVRISIPSDSNATLKADSLNGSITNDFGLPVRKGKYVGRDMFGKLGNGDVQVRLESVNGTLTVNRKNDGKSLSPAVNLLTTKSSDDDNWDIDNEKASMNSAKMNKDIAKAVKDAQKVSAKAMADAQVEMVKIAPELAKVAAEAAISAIDMERIAEVSDKFARSQAMRAENMVRLADLRLTNSMPRIEKKSGVFVVKGIPTITVNAKNCAVKVTGWDKPEVQYSLTQYTNSRSNAPVNLTETHTESSVNITIDHPDSRDRGPVWGESNNTRIEIFVPRKTNLKVTTGGELRVDGVSGNLELTGADEMINIRDSQGNLKITNGDGQVRIIGFNGEVDSQTGDGEVYLEGEFSRINGNAGDGSYILTVPDNPDAEIKANIEALTIENLRVPTALSEGHWRFGTGGPKYTFKVADGGVTVRSSASLNQ